MEGGNERQAPGQTQHQKEDAVLLAGYSHGVVLLWLEVFVGDDGAIRSGPRQGNATMNAPCR